jgi:hypothetical protein
LHEQKWSKIQGGTHAVARRSLPLELQVGLENRNVFFVISVMLVIQ